MSGNLKPWDAGETTEKARRALDRIREAFGVADLPAGLVALAASENGIQDVYMNAKRMLEPGELDRPAKLLVAVGVAAAAGAGDAVEFLGAAARAAGCSGQEVAEAVSIAAVCTIFNSYYRFRHAAPAGDFEAFRAPFNANTFVKPAFGALRLELICIAVSSLNGCGACVTGHIEKARSVGATTAQIDEAIRAGAAAQGLAVAIQALGR